MQLAIEKERTSA